MSDRIPMTRAGYDKIKADLDHLHTVEMPKIIERIGVARSEGDLSENAEYHGARESQGLLQARIDVLRDKLSRAVLIDPSQMPKGEITFGSTIRVMTAGQLRTTVADSAYIRESILHPGADVVEGFPNTMPQGRDVLSDEEINVVINFLKTVK